MVKLDSKQTPLYAGVVTFVALTLAAFLFADKFKFLQSRTQSTDADGKCPKKCCNACSLNFPLVLIFSAGLGVASSLLVMISQKEHREKLKVLVAGKPGTEASV
jgi:hypothetical protein